MTREAGGNVGHVWTDSEGRILDVTPSAASLLNVSSAALKLQRQISPFFVRDRLLILRRLDEAARGHSGTVQTVLRPRERRPMPMLVHLLPEAEAPGLVRWELIPQ